MVPRHEEIHYSVIIPKGKIDKLVRQLDKRRKKQLEKAMVKLQNNPLNLQDKNIEKLKNIEYGQYTIRVSAGDRIFYDVDKKNHRVTIVMAGKHDLYRFM